MTEEIMQCCSINQSLHLRLRRSGDIGSIANALGTNSDANGQAETIQISVAVHYFSNKEALSEDDEKELKALCRSFQSLLPKVQEVRIQILKDGIQCSNHAIGSMAACFPVYALKMILNAVPNLTSLKLQELKLCAHGGCDIARALQGHPSLRHFGWNHCIFLGKPGWAWDEYALDPILTSLSTIPTLESVVIQSPRRMTTSTSILTSLARNCPNLRELELRGLDVTSRLCEPQSDSPPLNFMHNLERLALDMYWTENRLTEASIEEVQVNKALANLHSTLPQLQRLTLHVNFQQTDPLDHRNDDLDDDESANPSSSKSQRQERKQCKVAALQNLQDAIAASIRYSTCLELLHIQAHDHPLSRRQDGPLPCLSGAVFREALESNSSLKHLRLPMNGDMYDERIDFFLRINQSGIRHLFLDKLSKDHHLQLKKCIRSGKTVTVADLQKEWWQALDDWSCAELMNFSMVYYCLRENPSMICR